MVIAPWETSTCRCPMFSGMGGPAGFCDKPAFGPQYPEEFFNPFWRRRDAYTGRLLSYWPFITGHACPQHHGPKEGDPIIFEDGHTDQGRPMYCAVMPGFVNLQESRAEFDADPCKAIARLKSA